MALPIEHSLRFDSAGKLDADTWLVIPRERVRPDLQLDAALADAIVRSYVAAVKQNSLLPVQVESDAGGIRLRAPLGKTAMLLVEPERILDDRRAETSWRIAGGFMLAHRVNYGGRFYLGVERQEDGALRIYSSTRRFPPRVINYFGVTRGIAVYHRTQGLSYKRIQEKFLGDFVGLVSSDSQ